MALKRKRGVTLPWEREDPWLRKLITGPQWTAFVLPLLFGALLWAIGRSADTKARMRATRIAIDQVHRAAAMFRIEVGRCPRSMHELLHPPHPATRHIRSTPVDGWDNRLFLRCPSREDPNQVDVISAGEAGSFAVDEQVE